MHRTLLRILRMISRHPDLMRPILRAHPNLLNHGA